jgi:hypothetical protein
LRRVVVTGRVMIIGHVKIPLILWLIWRSDFVDGWGHIPPIAVRSPIMSSIDRQKL